MSTCLGRCSNCGFFDKQFVDPDSEYPGREYENQIRECSRCGYASHTSELPP